MFPGHFVCDFFILAQQIQQRPLFDLRPPTEVVDEVVGVLPSQLGAQTHHDRLGDDGPVGHAEVGHHGVLVNLEPLDEVGGLFQRGVGQGRDLGQHDPLHLPGSGAAFVVLDHGLEQGGGELPGRGRHGGDVGAGDRVAFLGHGAARPAVRHVRLGDLGHLGLRQQFHVQRELGAGRREHGAQRAELGDPVALRVPRDLGHLQVEVPRQFALALQAEVGVAGGGRERGQGARRARELEDGQPGLDVLEPLPVPEEGGQQAGQLEPERHGDRLLQVRPRRHGRGPVPVGEGAERRDDAVEGLLEQGHGVPQLDHRRGVGDVLGRRPPVRPLAQARLDGVDVRDELLDHAEHRVPDEFGLGPEFVKVDVPDVEAELDDLVGGPLRDDAQARLGLGQGPLEGEVTLRARLVGPDGGGFPGREDVAKDEGILYRSHCWIIISGIVTTFRECIVRKINGDKRMVVQVGFVSWVVCMYVRTRVVCLISV